MNKSKSHSVRAAARIGLLIILGAISALLVVTRFMAAPQLDKNVAAAPVLETLDSSCGTYSNAAPIAVPASGSDGIASPYPSNIVVSGAGGAVTKVTVAINGLNHTSPDDIDVLLIGPEGQYATIISDVGGTTAVAGVNLVLDDSAPNSLPDSGSLVSGTFRPTNIDEQLCTCGGSVIDPFPSPVPWIGSTSSVLSAFNGTNPNGTWSLYVIDDRYATGTGDFSGGWAITISTDDCAGPTPTPQPTPTPGTTHFAVFAPGLVYQGEPFQFEVTALDRFNNTVTDYPGTIQFTSCDPNAILPPDSGLTNGTGTFTGAVGAFMYWVTITATDPSNPSITGASNCIEVWKHQPTPPITISGRVGNCASSAPTATPPAVPNVRMTLSGSASDTILTDGSGNYSFSVASGGTYTVTPSKTALAPTAAGINTVDAVTILRHFLTFAIIPAGCRLTAADVNGDNRIDTFDIVAIQRFFIGRTFGIGNVGKYQFSPASSTYPSISSNQVTDYGMYIVGDVAAQFANRPEEILPDAKNQALRH